MHDQYCSNHCGSDSEFAEGRRGLKRSYDKAVVRRPVDGLVGWSGRFWFPSSGHVAAQSLGYGILAGVLPALSGNAGIMDGAK